MDLGLRLTIAASLSMAPIVPLGARLAYLQVLRGDALSTRASGEFAREAREAAPRADLLDRKGRVLARSIPAWSCFVDKAMVKDPAAFGRTLAPLLGMPASEIARKTRAATRFAWLKTKMPQAEYQRLLDARVEGVGLVPTQERVYPNGDLARGVLGLVGAEGKGLAGLELSQEKRLAGRARRLEVIRDGHGRTIYKNVADAGDEPEPLTLTIDRTAQYLAEEALREGGEKGQFKEGAVAIQDPRTGEILAMAAWPPTPLRNPFVQDAFEPGSTFKVVTALAAVDSELVKPDETFSGEGGKWQVVPGVTITDHEPEGQMTLAQIMERSSNIGVAKVVDRVGASRFYRLARAFGFGAKTGAPLPGESAGELKPLSDLTKVGLAASSYGYGLAVSPLQMLGAYSAIANGGTLYEPKLIVDGKEPVKVRRVASERAVRQIGAMLEGVVDRGTAASARIPGYRAAGKTGTARKIDPLTRKYSTSAYTASFAGYLPASAPRWTILVILHEPKGAYYGGLVAAPIFARVGSRLLALEGVAPDRPADPALGTAKR
ncbi:MAG: penicillin-binding protein 2 [Elusimicrobiota bacterium]|nr:MAG: penicillin-binding protein 2 [Elusimicrobiota bacterium]